MKQHDYSLVYGKLRKADLRDVQTLAHKYEVSADLAKDIFLLVNCKGLRIMSRAGVARLIGSLRASPREKAVFRKNLEERYAFLKVVKSVPLFERVCRLKGSYTLAQAVDRLLALFRSAYRKHAQSNCAACPTAAACPHGQHVMTDGRAPAGNTLPGCTLTGGVAPVPGAKQLTQGATFLVDLLHPANAGISKVSDTVMMLIVADMDGTSYNQTVNGVFTATFTGEEVMHEMEEVVRRLAEADLKVFQLARVMDKSLAKTKGKKLDRSLEPDRQLLPEKMTSYADIAKVAPSVHALPDVLRNYKLALKQANVVEHKKPDSKKQLFYMLVDVSGSMKGQVTVNKHSFASKGQMASALVLACIKKVLEEKGMMFFRFFGDGVDILQKAKTMSDFAHLSRQVILSNYNDGGTNIPKAVKTACEDIHDGEAEIRKAEVLLVTDGEDPKCKEDALLADKKRAKTKLHVLEIVPVRSHGSMGKEELRKASDSFTEVDPENVDTDKIANAVPS